MFLRTAIGIAVGVAGLLGSASVSAQAITKILPVDVNVVNTASKPVPVTVIPPAPVDLPPTVTCRLNIEPRSSATPFGRYATSTSVGLMVCPAGVSRIDVQRVIFDPFSDTPSQNLGQFQILVALGPQGPLDDAHIERPIAMLSSGTPDLSLSRPVRMDKTVAGVDIFTRGSCTSGIAGLNPSCAGTIFFIGVAVN